MMQFIISISSQPFIKIQKNTFDFTPDKDNIVENDVLGARNINTSQFGPAIISQVIFGLFLQQS